MTTPGPENPEDALQRGHAAIAIQRALDSLPIDDRVAVKLVHAVEWLTPSEMAWLAGRLRIERDDVPTAITAAGDRYELTKIFDPGDDSPTDLRARRQRLDRFLKRVDRALDRVRASLGGLQ